jgi:hypothetical protein
MRFTSTTRSRASRRCRLAPLLSLCAASFACGEESGAGDDTTALATAALDDTTAADDTSDAADDSTTGDMTAGGTTDGATTGDAGVGGCEFVRLEAAGSGGFTALWTIDDHLFLGLPNTPLVVNGKLVHVSGPDEVEVLDIGFDGSVSDITGTSPTDVWATANGAGIGSAIVHFDGTSVSVAHEVDASATLAAIHATDSGVWAVGNRALLQRIGADWITPELPINDPLDSLALTDLDGVDDELRMVGNSAGLIWDGAAISRANANAFDTRIRRSAAGSFWGTNDAKIVSQLVSDTWQIQHDFSDHPGSVSAFAAFDDDDVWIAFGSYTDGQGPQPAVIEHFDGTAWTRMNEGDWTVSGIARIGDVVWIVRNGGGLEHCP